MRQRSGQGSMRSAVPDTAELELLPSPVERAERIGQLARTFGTLPPPLARLRRLYLIEALAAGWRVVELAAQVNLTHARVSQLTADREKADRG
jgi:hypothetical protein